MQCDQASELISLKQDAELSSEQTHELQQHLATCVACRRLMTQMEYTTQLMSSSRTLAPSADFSQRVMRQVRRRNRQRAVLGSLGVFVLASVLISILIFVPAGTGADLGMVEAPSMTGTFLESVAQFLGIVSTVVAGIRSVASAVLSSSGSVLVYALGIGGVFLTVLWLNALKLVSDRRR